MPTESTTPAQPGTLKRLLAGHPFFEDWDDDGFKSLAGVCQLLDYSEGERVLELGDLSPFSGFLLDGQLELTPAEGQPRVLQAGDLDAGYPFANLRPSSYDVVSRSDASILQIETSRLKPAHKRGEARFRTTDKASAGSWQAHPLVAHVARQMRANTLQIPPLPGIAMKVKKALERDDVDMSDVATIISADPAIAGRLIQVANSAVFGGQSTVDSVQGALVRMGLSRAQNIVISLASKSLYSADEPLIKRQLLERWRHAIDIAALGAVLGDMTPGLQGDVGMLVGLLHDIGAVPILLAAREYPDLLKMPGILEEILDGMAPYVTQTVLARWEFADEFIAAAGDADNWLRDHDRDPDYTDVMIVAHLHALVKQRQFKRLPRIDETPAFQKLALGQLSAKLSLVVLDQAKSQITELRSLLT